MRMQWIPSLLSPPPLEGLGTRLATTKLAFMFCDIVWLNTAGIIHKGEIYLEIVPYDPLLMQAQSV